MHTVDATVRARERKSTFLPIVATSIMRGMC